MHSENGYFKIWKAEGDAPRRVEASYSHVFQMNEFEFGELTSDKLTLQTTKDGDF